METGQLQKKPADLLLCKTCLRSCQTVREFLFHKCTCGKYPQNCDLCDKSINSKIELEVHYQCWHNILPRSQKDGPHRFSTSSNTPKVQSTLVPSETLGKTKPYARQSDSINTTLKQMQTQTDSDSSKASTAKRLTAEPPTSIENKSIENAIIKPGLDANLDIVGALHGVAAALQPITDLTCGKTETNPETTRIIGVLKNVASALNPLLKDNLTVKIKDKKTAEDRTIQDAIEQLHHLYVMLEKGLKEMIKNGKNSGKGESCYACTSLTVVINGTMEIIAKPKQTDIVHKMRLPVQQKVQRCIDISQPIPQHPQKVSTILKYSEKTGLTELSSQKVAGVGSPFHLPPGMMMVKCQDPVPGMLQHGIPLVRLPGFVQSLPRPASVPSKSHHGSVAVAASQMTSGTKPVILAASSVQNQMNQTSSPQLLFVPNTIKVTTTGQTIPTAITSYKPGGQLAINTQSHSVQPSQHRPASGNSCGAVADNQQARVEDPINMSKSSNNTTTFPSSSPQRPLTPEHANSTIPSSPGKHDGAGKIPTPHGKSSGNVSFEDQLVRIENLVEDLSTKKRKADSETTDCTANKQLKLETESNDGVKQKLNIKATDLPSEEDTVSMSTKQNESLIQKSHPQSSNGEVTSNGILKDIDGNVKANGMENGTTCQGSNPWQSPELKLDTSCTEKVDDPLVSVIVDQPRCKGCETLFPFLYQQYPDIKNVHKTILSDLTPPYKCPDCKYQCIDEMTTMHHYAEDHGGFRCPQCKVSCEDTSSLRHHVSVTHLIRATEV